MNIDEFEAGRELDALVAEKVMGRILIPDEVLKHTSATNFEDIPAYSTDISAAWQVVEKMLELGAYVDIGIDKYGAQVQLDNYDGKWESGESIRADNAPLAICRAALKALA